VLQRLIDQTESSKDDPHAALKGNNTPAILLFGECNFLHWKVTDDYRHTFADLKIVYFPRTGHYIQFEGAEMLTKVVRGSPSERWLTKVLQLTDRYAVSFYDAAYHAVAIVCNGLFVTSDTRYVNRVSDAGAVIALSDWQPPRAPSRRGARP
jgi:hypothetical protein